MADTIADLGTDLHTFYNANYRRWKLQNPSFVQKDGCLTWRNRVGINHEEDYEKLYQQVIDDVQYSLMIENRAVVQIYYQSSHGKVTDAALAFIPEPGTGLEYFRLDFDLRRAKHFSHTTYHAHFGFHCKEMRFSIKEFPYPSQFLRFICGIAFQRKIEHFNRDKFLADDLVSTGCKHHHGLGFIFAA